MSYVKIVEVLGKGIQKKRLIECECDYCKKLFTKRYHHLYLDLSKLTFCSRICSNNSNKLNGKVNKKKRQTSLERYGVEYALQSEKFKQKYRKTSIKRYGVEYALQSKEIKKKVKETCIEKYGVENPFQSNKVKEKIRKTCLKHYNVENPSQSHEIKEKKKVSYLKHFGVENPFQSNKVKEKIRKTFLKHYNVEYPLQSKENQEKFKKTCLDRYGVDNPLKSKEVQEKFKKTCLDRYGVDNPLKLKEVQEKINWIKAVKKRHQTMKQNGTYGKSKIEDKFYDYLCEKFGKDNIERQVRINGWNIDFHVKSINTYIQFDGVYWHGLNRPIEIIRESKHPRDKVIYQTFLRDSEQNEWFEENKLTLSRITDKEFLQKEKEEI